jgi:drug/metabolite transporter (DMT)-like permease
MLLSLGAPITAVMSAVALGERVDALRIVALGLGIAGALLLSLTRSASGSTVVGDLFELIQVVAFSAIFVLTRGLGTRYSPFFVSGVYGAVGMACLTLLGIATGRLASSAVQPFASGPATLWWFFGEMILGLSIYAQTAQAYALRTLGAGITSLLSSYGTLIVGLIGAVWLLDERLSPAGYVAAALLAAALALALVPRAKPTVPETVTA